MEIGGFDYPHTCVIKRFSGSTDDEGNIIYDELYSGACDLQYGSSGDTSLKTSNFQSEPTLFVPDNSILFAINDTVEVTVMNGRTQNFTIEQFRSIGDSSIKEMNDTCIWLKDGSEQ